MRAAVIGAGLAGCEAAWQLAQMGIEVDLYEMKPEKYSPAHSYPGMAELVCSNSLKAMRIESATGLLKEEMRRLGSLILLCAEKSSVAAGGALAVDRKLFSDAVTEKIRSHPGICVRAGEVARFPEAKAVVVATGPLTSPSLSGYIEEKIGHGCLSFFDAAAPIVSAESVDMDKAFLAARYGRGEADYINCPMDQEEYRSFYSALLSAQTVELKEFEKRDFRVYEGCMPVEVLARRGEDSIRFGPLKPVGLTDPRTGRRPWAVVQLRRENAEGTLYNLVGFQTNLKFPEQKRVFRMIPGLENAEFVRYGVMHRNTFLDSPRALDLFGRLKSDLRIFFAGQITGVEGYIESAASGILAGINAGRMLTGRELLHLPADTMTGALMRHVSDETIKDFQPMGCNMGLLPPPEQRIRDKAQRYGVVARRALESLEEYLKAEGFTAPPPFISSEGN